ncbi:MAG: twin-arginine translocase subunit TatC [Nanoarchaeota archaeon]|nr:twin-arginine translocase subunit TatC [Nanoarchaeota archaeon]
MEERNYTHSYVSELRKRIIAVAIFFIIALVIGMLFTRRLVLLFLNSNLPENVNLVTLNPYENISLFIHFTFFKHM